MKAHRLSIAAAAVCVLAVAALTLVPDAYATVTAALTAPYVPSLEILLAAPVALPALRSELADLEARAAAKIKELKDDTPADQQRTIEADHQKLLGEIEEKKRAIAAAEDEERKKQTRAWTAEEISKIKARGQAFGLRGEVVLEIMADPKHRSLESVTDALQDKAATDPASRSNPHIELQADEGDKLRAAVGDAILLRANPQAITGADAASRDRLTAARQYRGMSLLEMGREFMQQGRQLDLRGLSRMELATVLLGMRDAGSFGVRAGAGMHSTSDFANVLANVVSKRLRDAYAAAPQSWKQFCRQSNSPDFKEKSVVQLSSAPSFKLVREGQEYSHGAMTDGVEKYSLATYGRIVAITRQTIINDDLGAFDRLPTLLGRSAATLENTTVWSILIDNPDMNDGVDLFHADHGNLLNASAIDETNLGLARAAMRKQKSLAAKAADRENLNLFAKFLACGPDKEVQAQKMLSAVQATATSGVNPFANSMTLVVDGNITGNAWFTIADPATIDTIEYSYLEGEEGLFTEQRMGFEVDGIQVKGRLDFAAKPIDWRGMTKNPGA